MTETIENNSLKQVSNNECINHGIEILNPNLLERIKEYLKTKKLEIIRIDVELGARKGDNYCGTIARIDIEVKDNEGNQKYLNFISKSSPSQENVRKILKAEALYSKEINIYQNLFPTFENFQKMKQIADPFDNHPEFILSHIGDHQEHILMQDMKPLNYLMKSKSEVLNYEHVEMVLKTYAKFHALSYAIKDQNPEEFAKIANGARDNYYCEIHNGVSDDIIKQMEDSYRRQLYSCLDVVEDVKILRLLDVFTKNRHEIIFKAINRINGCSVVLHGDNWINNFMFKYKDETVTDQPIDVCFLDFQLSRLGSPAIDLSYFIYTCTDQDLRQKHFKQLLNVYYETLCQRIRELGSNPDDLVTFEDLENEFHNSAIVGFYLSTMVLRLMLTKNDKIKDWSKSEDINDLVESLNFENFNEYTYQKRIRSITVDFYERGYFDFLKRL